MIVDRAELWQRFLAHSERALAKPTFDSEERDPKIQIAEQLRAALTAAKDEGAWLEAVEAAFRTGLLVNLILGFHRDWVRSWAAANPESLRRALTAFLDQSANAEERFASFAAAAEVAAAGEAIQAPPDGVLLLGSLFNFALEPESLPVVRPWYFDALEKILGFERTAEASAPAAYAEHLAFAEHVRSELEKSELNVRDMIDVHSLIFVGALENGFWSGDRLYPIGAPLPDQRPRPATRSRTDARRYLSVCAVYRNEAPYLREWIEFHRLVGVEHFFLYDNMSTDAHREVLAPYLDDGIVTAREWKVAPLVQRDTYDDCVKEHGAESRWIAFIDIDEFLFSPTGRLLPEVLVEFEQWPGVGVNWACFGSSGHQTKPSGLVIENYLMRFDGPANRFIKSVVDPSRVVRCASAHHFIYDSVTTVDENHYPIHGKRSKSPSFSRLRLNHYVTKSHVEARTKLGRGTGWNYFQGWRSSEREHSDAQRLDRAITTYATPLRRALYGERETP